MAPKQVEVDKKTYEGYSGDSSGGSSGSSIMSAATDLGDKLHNNFLKQVAYFRDSREGRLRDAQLDAENKRQFNVGAGQTNRVQNMSGIAMLGQARQSAEGLSRQRGFRSDLSAALRRA